VFMCGGMFKYVDFSCNNTSIVYLRVINLKVVINVLKLETYKFCAHERMPNDKALHD